MCAFGQCLLIVPLLVTAFPAFAANPAITALSVSDTPDPFSPPTAGATNFNGTFRFSSRGPDVINASVTERSYLRMMLAVSGPSGAIVRTFVAQTSAAQMPSSPNIQTKTLTVSWNGRDTAGQPVPDGLYSYKVSGDLVLVRQLKKGPNTNPSESTLASSNTLVGAILVDSTQPAILILAPSDGSFVGQARPAVLARFSDPPPAPGTPVSGVNAASAKVLLDGSDVTAQATVGAAGFSYVPGAALSEGAHAAKVSLADFAGNLATTSSNFSVDLTPPVVSKRVPANGAFIKNARPAISASYADALSGVDAPSVQVSLDGSAVAASVAATGFSFTPSTPLSEGSHALTLRVADRVGNVTNDAWSFFVDAVNPQVLALAVTPQAITKEPRPSFSGSFVDPAPASGVDARATALLLDGADVTPQATVLETGFTFTPVAGLSEGTHILGITVADRAGNSAMASLSVTTDYTPPAAPLATSITRGPDRVTFFGDTEADVAGIQAEVSGAELESAVIASWSVVVRKTTSDTFTLTARLVDRAGNVGPAGVFTEHFASAVPPIAIRKFEPLQAKFVEGGVFFLDHTQVVFVAEVAGGQAPLSVQIGGLSASSLASQFTASLALLEGSNDVQVIVTDSSGQSASLSVVVQVDSLSPVVTIEGLYDTSPQEAVPVNGPADLNTAPLNFLYVNGLSGADSQHVRADSDLPRRVFSKRTLSLVGRIEEANLASDTKLTFRVDAGGTPVGGVKEFSLTVDAQGNPSLFHFDAPRVVAEDVYADAPLAYRVRLEVTDRLGHLGRTEFQVKVDTQAPQTPGLVSNHWTGSVLSAGGTPKLLTGPLAGVTAADDTIRVKQGSTAMLRAWHDGPWMLPAPLALSSHESEPTVDEVGLEDVAGNSATWSFAAIFANQAAGTYHEVLDGAAFFRVRFYTIDQQAGTSDVDSADDTLVEVHAEGTHGTAASGDQIDLSDITSNWCSDSINDAIDPPVPDGHSTVPFFDTRMALDALTLAGKSYAELPPSWSEPRAKALAVGGSFPFAATGGVQFSCVTQRAAEGVPGQDPNFLPPMSGGGVETASAQQQVRIAPVAAFPPQLNITATSAPQFQGNVTLDPKENGLARPGLNPEFLNYASEWSRRNRTEGPEEVVNEFVVGTTLYRQTQQRIEGWFAGSGFNGSLVRPRAFTWAQVTPDILLVGKRTLVKIRGFFGAGLKQGDTLPIAFAANGGTGQINIYSPQSQTPSPIGFGRLVLEDLVNSTVFQTVEVDLEPAPGALGIFDVTIGSGAQAMTLEKMVNIFELEWATKPEAAPINGSPLPTSYAAISDAKPSVHLTLINTSNIEIVNGSAMIPISGVIDDPIADNSTLNTGVSYVLIYLNNNPNPVATIPVYRLAGEAASFWRQHPFKGSFGVTYIPVTPNDVQSIRVVSAPNDAQLTSDDVVNVDFTGSAISVDNVEEIPNSGIYPLVLRAKFLPDIPRNIEVALNGIPVGLELKEDGYWYVKGPSRAIGIIYEKIVDGKTVVFFIGYLEIEGKVKKLEIQIPDPSKRSIAATIKSKLTDVAVLEKDISIMPVPDRGIIDGRSTDEKENRGFLLMSVDDNPIPYSDSQFKSTTPPVYHFADAASASKRLLLIDQKNISAKDYAKAVLTNGTSPMVFSHGNSVSIGVTGNASPVSAQDFIDAYKELQSDKKRITAVNIIFAGCNVGGGDNSMAQKIANEIPVTIWATGKLNVWEVVVLTDIDNPLLGPGITERQRQEQDIKGQFSQLRDDFLNGKITDHNKLSSLWSAKEAELKKFYDGSIGKVMFNKARLDLRLAEDLSDPRGIFRPYTKK